VSVSERRSRSALHESKGERLPKFLPRGKRGGEERGGRGNLEVEKAAGGHLVFFFVFDPFLSLPTRGGVGGGRGGGELVDLLAGSAC
jgi:hypothetical protein